MGLSTHILDLTSGQPAQGVKIRLYFEDSEIAEFISDSDGRCQDMLTKGFSKGVYRLEFNVDRYFEDKDEETFYGVIPVVFKIADTARHYHVPLLLSQYGYSTYRGS